MGIDSQGFPCERYRVWVNSVANNLVKVELNVPLNLVMDLNGSLSIFFRTELRLHCA